MKKGDKIELDITGYAYEGKGISKIDFETEDSEKDNLNKFVVFVNGSYPGDKVKASIKKKKSRYAEAIVDEILVPSPHRIEAKCNYFNYCGGCKAQDLNYETQLKYKEEQVREVFEKLGGFSDFESLPIFASEKIFFYRNKMEFSFADKRWLTPDELNNDKIENRNFALGLHIPRIFDKVLDIEECWLQSEASNKILNFTREFFRKRDVSIYSTKTHEGFLRNLIIKTAHHTNDLMVNLVTSSENEELLKEFSDQIIAQIPEITTVINNVNLKKSQTAIGDFEKVYFGEGFIFDVIGGFKFRISANSFFQTNTLQAENLYETAKEFADLKGDEIIYDLYSGAGTISIFVSKNAKMVFGFESVDPAVADAKVNAEINNIKNVRFFTANLDKSFLSIIKEKNTPKPDLIIADPPRSGMNPKTVSDILTLKPKKIVYVSCNPSTQARDIKVLIENGYKLIKSRAVDMFPHTYHIENVALLEII
ncbi:MAG: 23S rRNA (uracil(1939)-C(5))-methyltransferase RlmD [Bacteroidetes bacterium]|nr:23S rRNA (uracil(1939)-C(5))-methyltransferase RlmD [Bacteroidota bacterium]